MGFAFEYPQEPIVRRHGPRGYLNFKSFKPWLRDEFGFRCVYCLWRERWYANGDMSFAVEHLESRSKAPEREGDYENLVYSCCRCNAIKTDLPIVLDPCQEGFGLHLTVEADGQFRALSQGGEELIRACKLDEPVLTESRRRLIELFDRLSSSEDSRCRELLDYYIGLPSNLPCLSRLRPPGGNVKLEGISTSYYEVHG